MTEKTWLGEENQLGIDIWRKKYKFENETFEEWLDRVSGGNEEVKQLIIERKFLFGGRILSNRGLQNKGRKITYSNCFLPNQKVLTDNGYKHIQDVQVGDKVLTHTNSFKRVNAVLQREYKGEIYVINPRYGLDNIKCTPNHEFLTNRGWVKAEELRQRSDSHASRNGLYYDLIKTINSTNCINDKDDNRLQLKYNTDKSKAIKVINGDYYTQIKSIEKEYYDGTVYNLSVEEDHSYNVNGLIVHNCYVITPPEDNIESIFECAGKLARTYSYGGGCGVDISKLAPRGAKINNAAKETTGSVSFMDLYSLVTELIGQNGRRGALMISIDCTHPDLEEFIEIKSDLNKVTKANISIKVTKEFMDAVKNNEEFELTYTRNETGEVITKTVNARKIFEKMAKMNWDMAEPGVLYWDRIKNWNLLSECEEFEYAGTNPCAEEPLPPGGSCLLGSINLSEFVKNPFTKEAYFDYEDFANTVKIAVEALNEVLDEGLPLHPLQEQRDSVRDWRQIGLGIMGLADMLIKMGVRYGSEEAIYLCHNVGKCMINNAIMASALLAKEYGAFPKYDPDYIFRSDFFIFNTDNHTKNLVNQYGLRNSQLLTIAPTGSISTMIGVGGGIEPIYAISYTRTTKSLHKEGDVTYKIYTPIVKEYMEKHNIKDEKDLPDCFITAQNLDYKERINMQATWQRYIDASISSTVNVPNDFTVEEVFDLYLTAYEQGLKGITIFRDGCRRVGILSTDNKTNDKQNSDKSISKLGRGDIICVSDDLLGIKRTITNGCGKFYLQIFFDEVTGEPLESFINIGSKGGCERNLDFISRLISIALRAGVPIESIIDQAKSIKPCKAYTDRTNKKGDTSKGTSCPSAIGFALEELQKKINDRCFADFDNENEEYEEKPNTKPKENQNKVKYTCPECGEDLNFEGGCQTCVSCGFSKCE